MTPSLVIGAILVSALNIVLMNRIPNWALVLCGTIIMAGALIVGMLRGLGLHHG